MTLGRLAGRVFEIGQSMLWIFRRADEEPRRMWDPWKAKQGGSFFTPEPVAKRLAVAATSEGGYILDPAVGAGALLVEAYVLLRRDIAADVAVGRLFGMDIDPGVVELAAAVIGFVSGCWYEGRPPHLGTNIVVADSLLFDRTDAEALSRLGGIKNRLKSGGFDGMIMNPPYGQLKVNATSLPSRCGDTYAAQRARSIALRQARERTDSLARELRSNPDYSHAHGGIPDLPRFFIERGLKLMRPDGVLACIVPSTLLADRRSHHLRRHLLEDKSVSEIGLISEDERLFIDVNQPTAILVIKNGRSSKPIKIDASVDLTGLRSRHSVPIPRRLIRTLDPQGLRIPQCRRMDVEILKLIHRHPSLSSLDWIGNRRGELDLTLDRAWLRASEGLRLIRGDQIERYRTDLPTVKDAHVDPAFIVERVSSRKRPHIDQPRLVGRQCSYLKKPRRLSFALVDPPLVVANSCNYITAAPGFGFDERTTLLYLLALLNSSLIEWRFRLLSSTNHVSNYEIDSFPIPPPAGRLVKRLATLASDLTLDPKASKVDSKIDDTVFELFGLTSHQADHMRLSLE